MVRERDVAGPQRRFVYLQNGENLRGQACQLPIGGEWRVLVHWL